MAQNINSIPNDEVNNNIVSSVTSITGDGSGEGSAGAIDLSKFPKLQALSENNYEEFAKIGCDENGNIKPEGELQIEETRLEKSDAVTKSSDPDSQDMQAILNYRNAVTSKGDASKSEDKPEEDSSKDAKAETEEEKSAKEAEKQRMIKKYYLANSDSSQSVKEMQEEAAAQEFVKSKETFDDTVEEILDLMQKQAEENGEQFNRDEARTKMLQGEENRSAEIFGGLQVDLSESWTLDSVKENMIPNLDKINEDLDPSKALNIETDKANDVFRKLLGGDALIETKESLEENLAQIKENDNSANDESKASGDKKEGKAEAAKSKEGEQKGGSQPGGDEQQKYEASKVEAQRGKFANNWQSFQETGDVSGKNVNKTNMNNQEYFDKKYAEGMEKVGGIEIKLEDSNDPLKAFYAAKGSMSLEEMDKKAKSIEEGGKDMGGAEEGPASAAALLGDKKKFDAYKKPDEGADAASTLSGLGASFGDEKSVSSSVSFKLSDDAASELTATKEEVAEQKEEVAEAYDQDLENAAAQLNDMTDTEAALKAREEEFNNSIMANAGKAKEDAEAFKSMEAQLAQKAQEKENISKENYVDARAWQHEKTNEFNAAKAAATTAHMWAVLAPPHAKPAAEAAAIGLDYVAAEKDKVRNDAVNNENDQGAQKAFAENQRQRIAQVDGEMANITAQRSAKEQEWMSKLFLEPVQKQTAQVVENINQQNGLIEQIGAQKTQNKEKFEKDEANLDKEISGKNSAKIKMADKQDAKQTASSGGEAKTENADKGKELADAKGVKGADKQGQAFEINDNKEKASSYEKVANSLENNEEGAEIAVNTEKEGAAKYGSQENAQQASSAVSAIGAGADTNAAGDEDGAQDNGDGSKTIAFEAYKKDDEIEKSEKYESPEAKAAEVPKGARRWASRISSINNADKGAGKTLSA